MVLSEAFWEPLCRLNAVRQLCGLESLVEHDFNRYLKQVSLERMLHTARISFTIDAFSSVYYLGSRLLRDLVTSIEDWPGYSNPVNADFFRLEQRYSGGPFGVQQAYVLRRPARRRH